MLLGVRGESLSAFRAWRFRLGSDWDPAWESLRSQPVAGLLEHRGVNLIPRGDHKLCRSDALDVEPGIPRLWLADKYWHRVLNSISPIPTGKIRIENDARSTTRGVQGEAGSSSNAGYGQANAWITSQASSAAGCGGPGLASACTQTLGLILIRAVWNYFPRSSEVCVLAIKNTITEDEDCAFHTPTSQGPDTPMQSYYRAETQHTVLKPQMNENPS